MASGVTLVTPEELEAYGLVSRSEPMRVSHFSTVEQFEILHACRRNGSTWICRLTDICRLRTHGWKPTDKRGPARARVFAPLGPAQFS
jgi:hypothetical protein